MQGTLQSLILIQRSPRTWRGEPAQPEDKAAHILQHDKQLQSAHSTCKLQEQQTTRKLPNITTSRYNRFYLAENPTSKLPHPTKIISHKHSTRPSAAPTTNNTTPNTTTRPILAIPHTLHNYSKNASKYSENISSNTPLLHAAEKRPYLKNTTIPSTHRTQLATFGCTNTQQPYSTIADSHQYNRQYRHRNRLTPYNTGKDHNGITKSLKPTTYRTVREPYGTLPY